MYVVFLHYDKTSLRLIILQLTDRKYYFLGRFLYSFKDS